tara:strand:+ start:532 stop:1734 length:1203 start_codon:yes stop_codon:yes gene_type:complete
MAITAQSVNTTDTLETFRLEYNNLKSDVVTLDTTVSSGTSVAADNITVGDAAVSITTSVGNITIDAAAGDADIIFKGTDGAADITALTLDMSDAGKALFTGAVDAQAITATTITLSADGGVLVPNDGNIGSAGSTAAMQISSGGVVTFVAVPLFPNNTIETADIQDDAVTTAKIPDNAITLAKLAGGTDGNIISFDASGDPVAVVTGDAGQVLTSAGTGAPPTFADPVDSNSIVLNEDDTLDSIILNTNADDGDNLLYEDGTSDFGVVLGLPDTLLGSDQIVERVNLKDYAEVTNAIGAIGGGTQDIDLELGNNVVATVDTGTTTFTFSNPAASPAFCGFTLFLTNGGSQTVNWPASVDFPAGTAPTLTASGLDILVFVTTDGGTIYHGMASSLASATPS